MMFFYSQESIEAVLKKEEDDLDEKIAANNQKLQESYSALCGGANIQDTM